MSHPAGLPDIFLDRSLGRKGVPDRLRSAGLRVITLAEHYGLPADEDVADETWLELVAQRNWIAFMKDRRVRTREGWAVNLHGVRCFCLHPSHGLKVQAMADRFLDNLAAIRAACIRPGPFFYHVQANGIRLQRLPI